MRRIYTLLFILLLSCTNIFASQKITDNIAQVSASSLYNIDKASLQNTVKASIRNYPNLKALKITESLSGESYLSIYKDDKGIFINQLLDKDLEGYPSYESKATYSGEEVGSITAYYENTQLNNNEISWIKSNHIISIAVVRNYKPYDMIDDNNKLFGFHSDITNLINKKLASNIKLIPFNSWNDAYTSASKGEVHGIFSLSWSKQREEKYFNYSPAYHFTPYHLLVKKDNQNITTLESLKGKKIAIENNTIFSQVVKQRVPSAEIILVNKTDDTFKSVSTKETNATISASLDEKILEKYNLKVASEFYHKSSELYIGVSKKFPILSSILTKGLNSISLIEMANLRKKWFEDFSNKSSKKEIIKESPFTQKEQEWINTNPIVKVAFMNYWPKDDNGDNINSDLLKLLNKYSNLHFVPIKYNSWGAGYNDAVSGDIIHGILNLSWTKEREENFFNYTKAYNLIPNYLITKKDNKNIKTLDDLKNKKIYLRKGSVSNKTIKNRVPTAKIVHIEDESVLYETFGLSDDADAILDYILDKKKIENNNLKIIETFYDKYSEVAFGISKKHPTLYPIIEKIYKKIPKNELLKLQKKDYSKKVLVETKKVSLTKEEQTWLENHKNIKVGIQDNWAPLNYVNEFGTPKGLGVDFINILNKRLNGILKIYPDSFKNSLEKVKTKEIDAMLDITPTKSRKEFYHFTTPYITIPKAIVTRKDSPVYYKNEAMLYDKKVGIEKGYLTSKILEKLAPGVTIVDYDSTTDALDAVSRGNVDAYVGNKAVVNYIMQRDFITNLTFHARTKNRGSVLAIGVRKDWSILRDILQKALNSITPEDRKNIVNKYISEEKLKDNKTLNIAFHFDRPPYMFGKTSSKGIEVDLVKEIFELQGYKINIHQMSKVTMENLLETNPSFDAVASVSDPKNVSFYSDKYSLYEDFAITRKSENIQINNIEDLSKYNFVSWKNAYNDLGEKFYKYFNPKDGLYKSKYHDATSQREQHKLFFDKKTDVIVVDKFIFKWFKLDFNKKDEYTFHKILPLATNSGVKFRDKRIRDIFNEGLKKIKKNGRYKEIVDFYLTQDIRPLLKYSNLIADISGRFIFTDKIHELQDILSKFFKHPDLEHIEIFDNSSNLKVISLHKHDNKIISGVDSKKHIALPSIIKKVFYSDEGNPISIGSLKIYYKKQFKLGNLELIPSFGSFKDFDRATIRDIKKSYDKFINKDSKINLTAIEQEWIDSNIVKVGIEEWAPVVFSHGGNDFDGITGDVLRLVIEKTGLNVEVVNDLWDSLLTKFKNKKVDLLPATYYTDERATYGLYSQGYYKMLDYIYIKEDNNHINSMEDLNGKYLAIPKEYGTIPKIKKKFPEINIVETRDSSDSIQRVLRGEVDALYDGQIAVEYKMQEELIVGLKGIPQKSFSAAPIHFFSHIDKPILRDIINKALKEIPIHEINKIKSKWLVEKSSLGITQNNDSKMDAEETWWLIIAAVSVFLLLLFILLIITRFVSNEFIAKSFGSVKFRIIALIILSIIVFMLSVLVSITLSENKKSTLLSTKSDLEFVLKTTQDRLDTWISERKNFLIQVGRDSELVKHTKSLLKIKKDSKNLISSSELKNVRNFFDKRKKEFGTLGFFIIDKEFISIVSKRDTNIGTKNLIAKHNPKLLERVFNGEAIFIPPIKTDVAIKMKNGDNEHTMFFAIPIQDQEGNVLAIMTQRLDVEGEFSKIIQSGRIGQSGESYLFSKDGFMLTKSRFRSDLIKIGLLNKNEKEYEKIQIRDPGGNLLEGYQPRLALSEQPFTKMTKHAIALDDDLTGRYSRVYSDVEGYRDYRGVDVFGAWIWYDAFGFGLSTELDEEEALSGFYILRQSLLIITILTLLLTVLATVMLIILGEKATRSVQKANKELNKLLSSFDENVIASRSDLKGNITYASKAFAEISGYSIEELVGKPHSTVRHPEMSKKIFEGLWKTIKSGKIWRGEVKNRKKDGGMYWVEVVINPEFDEKDNIIGYSAIRNDITSKKEVEDLSANLESKVKEQTKDLSRQLRIVKMSERKQEELFNELNQNKLFVDALLDSQEQIVITTDGKILRSVNKKFLRFFVLENMEEFTKDYDCICDRFEKDETNTYLQKEMGELTWIDYVLEHEEISHKAVILKKNIERIFSVSAAVMPIEDGSIKSVVFTDITELENQKKQTESILSSVLLPMLITSKNTRRIVYANTYAEKQYETTLDEIVGSTIDIFYTGEKQKEDILLEMREKGTVQNFETKFKTLKGNEFDALLSLVDINYGGEECFLGVTSDISEQKNREVIMQKLHKNITDSIEYASLIQHSLIPDNEQIREYFEDYFTIWHPKDIVGGDIYLFEELRNQKECLLMVIDCTGHGVPGAFVTMLVKAIERQVIADIINSTDEVSPAFILEYFNKTMKKLLKQENDESISNAGFDGGILYYNKDKNIIRYAGAETPLFYIQNNELNMIKGDRHSIGYKKSDTSYKFTDHEINIDTQTKIYITTDGYFDQNGGEKSFPYSKKRFKKFLEEIHTENFIEQKELLLYEMQDYQLDEERNDDVTVVGLNIQPK